MVEKTSAFLFKWASNSTFFTAEEMSCFVHAQARHIQAVHARVVHAHAMHTLAAHVHVMHSHCTSLCRSQ
jgi:hypothetical protein